MIAVDGDYSYIDMEAIFDFIFEKSNENPIKDVESIMDDKKKLIQQTTIERNSEDKYANIRYDLVKEMLLNVYNSGIESEEGNIKYVQNLDEISIGSKLAYNSLSQAGFIKNKLK